MTAAARGEGGAAVRCHLLAARSVVFGTCNLVLLGVPAGWRLGDGAFPPEVDRWAVRDGISWATAASGHWWLAATSAGTAARSRGSTPTQGADSAGAGLEAGVAGAEGVAEGADDRIATTAPSSEVGRRDGARRGRRLQLRVELFLEVRPRAAVGHGGGRSARSPAARSLDRLAAEGTMELAGHRCWWARGAVRRGFPGRWRPARALVVDCPDTGRRIALRFEAAPGSGEPEVEAAWEAALRGWRCH